MNPSKTVRKGRGTRTDSDNHNRGRRPVPAQVETSRAGLEARTWPRSLWSQHYWYPSSPTLGNLPIGGSPMSHSATLLRAAMWAGLVSGNSDPLTSTSRRVSIDLPRHMKRRSSDAKEAAVNFGRLIVNKNAINTFHDLRLLGGLRFRRLPTRQSSYQTCYLRRAVLGEVRFNRRVGAYLSSPSQSQIHASPAGFASKWKTASKLDSLDWHLHSTTVPTAPSLPKCTRNVDRSGAVVYQVNLGRT